MTTALGDRSRTGTLIVKELGTSNEPVSNLYVTNQVIDNLKVGDVLEFDNQIQILQPTDNRIKIGNLDPLYVTPADSIVIGNQGKVGESSVSIGSNGGCDGERNVAVGFNSGELSATSENNVSVGSFAGGGNNPGALTAQNSIFIGNQAEDNPAATTIENVVCIGHQANIENDNDIAIGYKASATGTEAIAIGEQSSASGDNSITIGEKCTNSGRDAIVIGTDSVNNADECISIGNNIGNNSLQSIRVGYNSGTTSVRQVAIGAYSFSQGSLGGTYGVGVGYNAGSAGGGLISGDNVVCLGAFTTAKGDDGIAIGYRANANGLDMISIGEQAGLGSTGTSQINIGHNAGKSTADYAIHIGHIAGTNNTGEGCIALGEQTMNDGSGDNTIAIGRKIGATAVLPANSIILSADNSNFNPSTPGVYINGINDTSQAENSGDILHLNPTTKELYTDRIRYSFEKYDVNNNGTITLTASSPSVIIVNWTGGTPTLVQNVRLPVASTVPVGTYFMIKNFSQTGGYNVTVTAQGADTIDKSVTGCEIDSNARILAGGGGSCIELMCVTSSEWAIMRGYNQIFG